MDEKLEKHVDKLIEENLRLNKKSLDAKREAAKKLKRKAKSLKFLDAPDNVAIYGTDGGNNTFSFDAAGLKIVRVSDNNNNFEELDIITDADKRHDALDRKHLNSKGEPIINTFTGKTTSIGKLMYEMGFKSIEEFTLITQKRLEEGSSWLTDYRELMEWAVVYNFLDHEFLNDTVILREGQLRSKIFRGDYLIKIGEKMNEKIENQYKKRKKNIYLAAVAKSSSFIDMNRMALLEEKVMVIDKPACVYLPEDLEQTALNYGEWGMRINTWDGKGEVPKQNLSEAYLAKFGPRKYDKVYPVDIFYTQDRKAERIISTIAKDSQGAYPIPSFPKSLQRAHDKSAITGLFKDELNTKYMMGVRKYLGSKGFAINKLLNVDYESRRYGS